MSIILIFYLKSANSILKITLDKFSLKNGGFKVNYQHICPKIHEQIIINVQGDKKLNNEGDKEIYSRLISMK